MVDQNKSKDSQTGSQPGRDNPDSKNAEPNANPNLKNTTGPEAVKADQTTLPATGSGVGGTGSSNPEAIAREQERLKQNASWTGKSAEQKTQTAGTTSSQPKASEGQFEADENNTVFKRTEDKDGKVTTVSSVSEAEAANAATKAGAAPAVENLTMAKEGVPGNVDLTAGGTLNSDKSMRDPREIDEINEEEEDKSGPNPIPNRDGNEITRGYNQFSAGGPSLMFNIDQNTNKMAEQLQPLIDNKSLSEDDRKKLRDMQKKLRETGKQ